jgi:hypothetical protein
MFKCFRINMLMTSERYTAPTPACLTSLSSVSSLYLLLSSQPDTFPSLQTTLYSLLNILSPLHETYNISTQQNLLSSYE